MIFPADRIAKLRVLQEWYAERYLDWLGERNQCLAEIDGNYIGQIERLQSDLAHAVGCNEINIGPCDRCQRIRKDLAGEGEG